MDNDNTTHIHPLGYVFDAANNPFEVLVFQDEGEVQVPQRQWQQLDNQIHPLWRWQAWKNLELKSGEGADMMQVTTSFYDQEGVEIPRREWDRMQPALRLATMFLHRARPIFAMLLTCPVVQVGPEASDISFDPSWHPQPRDISYLDAQLLEFSQEYRVFQMSPQPMGTEGNGRFVLGITSCPRNTDADYVTFATRYPIVSAIAVETMQEFSDERWLNKPIDHQFALLINLAQTLVHELAHAIFFRRKYLESMLSTNDDFYWWAGWEPKIFKDRGNEIGYNVCLWLLGVELVFPWGEFLTKDEEAQGLLNPPRRPMLTGSKGLLARGNFAWNAQTCYTVSRRTLKWLFDRRTWLYRDPIPLHLANPDILLTIGPYANFDTTTEDSSDESTHPSPPGFNADNTVYTFI